MEFVKEIAEKAETVQGGERQERARVATTDAVPQSWQAQWPNRPC
jgi:hypothetical protein